MLYDDIVAEFRWSPEQMSAPFDLKAADDLIRRQIESRRGSAKPKGQRQGSRQPQAPGTPQMAGGARNGGFTGDNG